MSLIPVIEPLLVDVPTAAKMLSVCEKTLWSLTAPRGDILPVRVGRAVRYSPDDLRAWIDRSKKAGVMATAPATDSAALVPDRKGVQ